MRFTILALFIVSFTSFANIQNAKITKLKGEVNCFLNPKDLLEENSGQVNAKIGAKYYSFIKAEIGQEIKPGDKVETGASSFARLVFPNGDQFIVGPGTSYELTIPEKSSSSAGSALNILRGKMRIIISKEGPRNNQKIETKVASLGVRGTDFFVSQSGSTGATRVAVIRGQVQVSKDKNRATLQKGQSASVDSGLGDVLLKKTTKEELVAIHQASTIILTKEERAQEKKNILEKNLDAEWKVLAQNSVKVVLKDIKTYDPELYAEVTKKKAINLDQLNTQVVKKLFKDAPKARSKADLEGIDLDQDYYKKYFSE